MPRSLSIECEWEHQPAALDPLERLTWSRIRISARGHGVTWLQDRQSDAERTSIYVPAFPVARWVVSHWWALLHEPLRASHPKAIEGEGATLDREWTRRHCLRAAESGLFLPRLFLFSDGRQVCAQWTADDESAHPNMPGYFLGARKESLATEEVRATLIDFVSSVVSRVAGSDDPRAKGLRDNWAAITSADPEESSFCRAAARLGLDPYAAHSWSPGLAELIETGIGPDTEKPLVADFLEASEPATAVETWKWIDDTVTQLKLTAAPAKGTAPPTGLFPAESGYQAARRVRGEAHLGPGAPLKDLGEAAKAAGIGSLSFEPRNHLVSKAVKAAVGWKSPGAAVIAGPGPAAPGARRFLEARALYLAAFGTRRGTRLVTQAATWDQQAARAFAAELLAPREALLAELRGRPDTEESQDFIERLAGTYVVSSKVIELQFENAGVTLESD